MHKYMHVVAGHFSSPLVAERKFTNCWALLLQESTAARPSRRLAKSSCNRRPLDGTAHSLGQSMGQLLMCMGVSTIFGPFRGGGKTARGGPE
jgi:hypothetical protein